ncbi:MAG: HupE/UreJ family protein [Steroidobacteraceae bacterium]
MAQGSVLSAATAGAPSSPGAPGSPGRLRLIRWCLLWLLGGWHLASAHVVPGTALYLDIGVDRAVAQMDLPLSELQLALPAELQGDLTPDVRLGTPAGAALARYVSGHFEARDAASRPLTQQVTALGIQHVGDGDCLVVTLLLRTTAGADLSRLWLHDTVIAHQVASHKIYVFQRRDFRQGLSGHEPKFIGVLYAWNDALTLQRADSAWWRGALAFFALGREHIATGIDHLLFLLTLLLIAPLRAAGRRWQDAAPVRRGLGHVLRIVTGFTLGHSLTLALAALGLITPPVRLIEILVAVSILVSALHAIRPFYAGRETWIATGFGLVHGMAFAEALGGFGYDSGALVLSLASFNLGIEAMQLAIVALCLPWLMLLARTSWYALLRLPLAGVAAAAALAWIGQRAFNLPNPLEPLLEALAAHAWWLLAALAALALGATLWQVAGRHRCRPAADHP